MGQPNIQPFTIFACPNMPTPEYCEYINTLKLIYGDIVNIRMLQHPNIQTPEDTNKPSLKTAHFTEANH